MLFADLKPGDRALVKSFADLDASYRHQLMNLGLTPGTELLVQRLAPLGDPVEIKVHGYHLCLRRDEAAAIQVERL